MAWSDARRESRAEPPQTCGDDEGWHELTSFGIRLARDAGALISLPVGLTYHASLLVFAGEFAAATTLLDEAEAIATATGNALSDYISPLLAAMRGNEALTVRVVEAYVQHATARGGGRVIGHAEHAAAVLYNGLSRYGDAVAAAQRACEHEDLGVFGTKRRARHDEDLADHQHPPAQLVERRERRLHRRTGSPPSTRRGNRARARTPGVPARDPTDANPPPQAEGAGMSTRPHPGAPGAPPAEEHIMPLVNVKVRMRELRGTGENA
jgi:hypothetical protein